jgi:hypothetical protein
MIVSCSTTADAYADAVLLIGNAPSSLTPMSVSELHLYAYLGNLIAFSQGQPVSDWGYRFTVTREGFPFSQELEQARCDLVNRSIIVEQRKGLLQPDEELFEPEYRLMLELSQTRRREIWQKTSLACALNLPSGAVRHAINQSPGMAINFQQGRAGELLRSQDTDRIYEEFEMIREFLDEQSGSIVQPAVTWLAARVLSGT